VTCQLREIFDESQYSDLLVGLASADDAAVWRLDDDRALVFTADFFTPVVDDPYAYGAIAAANALSDVYAMGGDPFLALNLAAFPSDLPEEIVSEIIRGSAEKVREAGAIVAGGHTIDDDEPKFGLAVLGFVSPDRVGIKGGAKPGDTLILTKPLGTGIITTAYKADMAEAPHMDAAVESMTRLNRRAALLLRELDAIRGITDITGFGLLGHAYEVAVASRVRLRFEYEALPFLPGARRYADELLFPAMAGCNMEDYGANVAFEKELSYEERLLLFCPETSGGLLVSLSPQVAEAFVARRHQMGEWAWIIGQVLPEAEGAALQVV